ncbi:MAG: hypothetical protein LUD76_09645 [Alistipes sp.]|nr:hypothetical protein [Alistipes sp.]
MANDFESDYWNDDYTPDPDVFGNDDGSGTDFIMQYDYDDNVFVNDDCGCRVDSTFDNEIPDEIESMDQYVERGTVDVLDPENNPDPNLYEPEDFRG